MLAIKFIKDNVDLIRKTIKLKGVNCDLDRLLVLDQQRLDLIHQTESLRSEKKQNIENVKSSDGQIDSRIIEKGKELKSRVQKLELQLQDIIAEYGVLMLSVPNIVSDDTPVGPDSSSNVELYKWGTIPEFNFKQLDHVELGSSLGLFDLEAGVKTSGYRGYYLLNEGVLLHMGLLFFSIQKMLKNGFQLVIPPILVKEFALLGSGHLSTASQDIYKIAQESDESKDNIFLSGTSEPGLLALYSEKILSYSQLPLKICGVSTCYRSEIGSYGKDTKGLYRVHEFWKVEQMVLCKNDVKESNYWLDEMKKVSEEILQDLKLPYRVLQICTGDMGLGKYKMYDIETWMPSRNTYGETHSDSNLTDWQSRRLNIKYKTKNNATEFVHTLNNTVIASPRILIAILENYQQADGSVIIPEVLRPYVGKDIIQKI